MSIAPYYPPSALATLPRGNILLWSGDQTNAAWQKTHTSVVAGAANDVNGQPTACAVISDATNNQHEVWQAAAGRPNIAYTLSAYLQKNARKCVLAQITDWSATSIDVYLDLNAGTVVSAGVTGANAVLYGVSLEPTAIAGLWRVVVTGRFTNPAMTLIGAIFGACDDGAHAVWTGDAAQDFFVSQVQLEPGDAAGAYLKTTAAADSGVWGGVQGLPVLPFLPGQAPSVSKSPKWSTQVVRTASGRERRTAYWPSPLWQFELSYEVVRHRPQLDELAALWEVFNVMQGQFGTFLFVDPTDCQVPASAPAAFGTGDGSTKTFQLQRPVNSFSEPVYAVYRPAVLENGSPAGAYALEPNGQIVFAAAPASGVALTWSGYFYFGCRFLDDELSFEQIVTQLWSGKSLKFTSLRP